MAIELSKIDRTCVIEWGDTVKVNFMNSKFTLCDSARVISMPRATGDSWVFKEPSGQLHYVSEGCTVSLIKKAERK